MDNKNGIGLLPLIAISVSSAIGVGIFTIPSDIAQSAAPGEALVAWLVVGIGILALAMSMNNLTQKRPHLTGLFQHAQADFGPFAGFFSGWGYWMCAWLGNVAFATVLMSSLGYFMPMFNGQNIPSIIGASIISWGLTWLVMRGVESAALLNTVVAIAKLIPLFTFIVVGIMFFKADVFGANFWHNMITNTASGHTTILNQLKGCMMIMVWVFVGIEGSVMMGARAKHKSDAGRATVIGMLCLLFIYVLASMLPFGYFNQEQLATIKQPGMVYIFRAMLGEFGGAFISLGLIISILGAWLSWTMLPAEALELMSHEQILPKSFGKTNKKGAPSFALMATAVLVQLFLLTLVFTTQAYNFAFSMATVAIVITYIFVGASQIKVSWQFRHEKGNYWQLALGIIALAFQLFVLALSGLHFLLLCMIAYVPGFYAYYVARKTAGATGLSQREKLVAVVVTLLAVLAIVLVAMGKIAI